MPRRADLQRLDAGGRLGNVAHPPRHCEPAHGQRADRQHEGHGEHPPDRGSAVALAAPLSFASAHGMKEDKVAARALNVRPRAETEPASVAGEVFRAVGSGSFKPAKIARRDADRRPWRWKGAAARCAGKDRLPTAARAHAENRAGYALRLRDL